MALNRLSQRLTESFKESTRDLPILQGKGPTTQAYFEYNDEKLREISQLLDGSSSKSTEADRLEGMKRLIGMISKGRDMSGFFPQVVKQVGSSSVEIRKLVYIYLLRYAESNSDLLLLSINTFQKDLADSSPLIRGMAIRVLTSIRLNIIQGIVFLGMQKLVNDRNQWVRKTVALGLIKIYDSDATSYAQIMPLLEVLLRTATPITIGATLEAVDAICPDNLALLHSSYRRICQLLVDADEWSQVTILTLMLRYARMFLEQPRKGEKQSIENIASTSTTGSAANEEDDIDPDLALLLQCTLPLLQSRNASVVIAAVRLFYLCGPLEDLQSDLGQQAIVTPLLRLSYGSSDTGGISSLCWEILKVVAEQRPWLLHNELRKILVRSSDSAKIKSLKIHILTALINEENVALLVKEFKEYARYQGNVSKDAIIAIGVCAEKVESVKPLCGNILLALVKSGRDSITAQAVVILRSLVKSTESHSAASRLVAKLCQVLPLIRGGDARASIYWLGTQHAAVQHQNSSAKAFPDVAVWAPDLLRNGVKGFVTESPLAKIEILNLAASLMAQSPGSNVIALLSRHVLALARYDHDWDVRDRSRLLSGLLRGCSSKQSPQALASEDDMGGVILRPEQIQLVLCGPTHTSKNTGKDIKPTSRDRPIASLSGLGDKAFSGSKWDVPDWTTEPTDSTIRDTVLRDDHEPEISRSSTPLPSTAADVGPLVPKYRQPTRQEQPPKKYKNLDEFLEESDDSDESEEREPDETFKKSQYGHTAMSTNHEQRQSEQGEGSETSSDESDDSSSSGYNSDVQVARRGS